MIINSDKHESHIFQLQFVFFKKKLCYFINIFKNKTC
jgi:hypothetical protein